MGRLTNAFGTMHEGQHIQIFTAPGFELEIKPRLFWESTTRYSHIFPVKLPPHTSAWQVTKKAKQEMYGNVASPGISSQSYIKVEGAQPKKGPNDTEPFNWFHMPPKLGQELIYDFDAKRIVHMCAGDGWLMLSAFLQRCPGIFMTFSKVHEEKLIQHVVEELFRMCQDPKIGWLHTQSIAIVKDILAFKEEQDKKKAKLEQDKKNAKGSEGAKPKSATPTTTPTPTPEPAKDTKQKDNRISASHKKRENPR